MNKAFKIKKRLPFFNGALLVLLLCVLLDLKRFVDYPDTISVAFTGLLFLICFICAIKILLGKGRRHGFILAFSALMLLFTIYGALCILKGESYTVGFNVYSNRMYIMDIYVSLLPIYAFYYYASVKRLKISALRWFFIISAVLAVLVFFKHQQEAMLNAGQDAEGVVNNYAYTFLSLLLGVALFTRKRIIQYLIFAFVAVFLLLGLKRGAMLIYPFCLFYFLSISLKEAPARYRFWVFLVASLFIVGLVWYIGYRYSTDIFFQRRMELTEEGNVSRRDILFKTFWEHFIQNQNPLQQLFGEGAMATVKLSFNFAHNDWLEILINQGLFGVLIFLIYWVSLIKVWLKSRKRDSDVYLALGLFVIIFLSRSFFSMGYTGCTFFSTAVFGYYLNRYYSRLPQKVTVTKKVTFKR